MSTPKLRYRSDKLPMWWARWGLEVHRLGLSIGDTQVLTGLSERKSRRLVAWVREHGPPECQRPEGRRIHLVIPDTHARREQTLHRFSWAGRMIRDIAPDAVIHLGDHYHNGAVSHWDKGKIQAEGQRLTDDEQAGDDALDAIEETAGKGRWAKFVCAGNHDEWVEKYVSEHPELSGYIRHPMAYFERLGWEAKDHMVPHIVDGIGYAHSLPSGLMSRPVSGVNMARTLVMKAGISFVAGHSHTLDYSVFSAADGSKRFGHAAGCYVEGRFAYAKATQPMWSCGISVLRYVGDGWADLERWSYERIRDEYSQPGEVPND